MCHELKVCVCVFIPDRIFPATQEDCVAWLCPKLVCAREWHSCNTSQVLHSFMPLNSLQEAYVLQTLWVKAARKRNIQKL